MKFTDLLKMLASRKAEIVVVTLAALCYVSGLEAVDRRILLYTIVAVTWTGSLGITAQLIIDYKHPKRGTGAMTVSQWIPASDGGSSAAEPVTGHPTQATPTVSTP